MTRYTRGGVLGVCTLLLYARLASAAMNADMAHLPDFTKDPAHQTRVVTGVETITGPILLENVVVQAGGDLTFSGPNIDLITLVVMSADGMGRMPGKVRATIGANVYVRDVPLNLTFDPDQFSNGAIIMGDITWVGTPKTAWTRLAAEPKAGDTTVKFSMAVVGYKVGDEINLPDSSQCATDDLIDFTPPGQHCKADHSEHRWLKTIAADRLSATLNLPLSFDHPGAWVEVKDPITGVVTGQLLYLMPFVSNQTRDITFASRNPSGTRAHFMVTGTAGVDIENVQFDSGGRTCFDKKADNTVWVDGAPTHLGTCQKGRYNFHFHRVSGTPTKLPKFTGNALNDCGVWCIAIHQTNYATVKQNSFVGAVGAGIVFEEGSETANLVAENFGSHFTGTRVVGIETDDIVGTVARGGSCMWGSTPDNYINGNVCVDSAEDGFKFIIGVSSNTLFKCPAFAGADLMDPTQTVSCRPDMLEPRSFDGNVSWRARTGVFFYQVGKNTQPDNKPRPFTANGMELVYNLEGFRVANADQVVLNNFTCVAGYKVDTGRLGPCVQLDQNRGLIVNGTHIYGSRVGIAVLQAGYADLADPDWLTINGKFADGSLSTISVSNVGIARSWDPHNQPRGTQSHAPVILNDLTVIAPLGAYKFWPNMLSGGDGTDVTVLNTWLNNRVNGKDTEIFAPQQLPNAPMAVTGSPYTDPVTGFVWKLFGAMAPGTNAETWAREGLAFSGRVATCTNVDPSGVYVECPQGGVTPPPATVTAVTVTGQTAFTAIGQSAQFAAVAKLSDNTTNTVTGSASWQSSNPMVATAAAGLVTARGAGTATISATASGIVGTLPITVTVVTPPPPTTLNCTLVPTGTSTDGGVTVVVNPASLWQKTCK